MNKVLFISSFFPSSKTAGQAYSLRLIEHLSKNNSKVDIFAFYNTYQESDFKKSNLNYIYSEKLSLVNRFINFCNCLFVHPALSSRFSILKLIKLRKIINDYDVVYFDYTQSFLYSIFLNHRNKIHMAHDILIQKYIREDKSWLNLINKKWIQLCESILFKALKNVYTFSCKDNEVLETFYEHENALSVPFFLDDRIYNISIETKDYFIMYGSWSRVENFDSLKYFFSTCDDEWKSQKIVILGSGLDDLFVKELLSQGYNIEYKGFVDNPYIYLSKAKALLATLRYGAGVKVKVIESFACGTPVIGTNIAFEGIDQSYSNFMLPYNCHLPNLEKFNIIARVKFKEFFRSTYGINKVVEKILN
jgi:glycosyltransferase involved in cell wall biosynthesis